MNAEIQLELLRNSDFSDISGILVIFSHGFEEGIVINGVFMEWEEFSGLLYSSKAAKIYLACCFGANIYKYIRSTEKIIFGCRGVCDALLIAQTIAYFINYEYEYIDDANINLSNLKNRLNLLNQHPKLTIPLLKVKMEKVEALLWSSFRFHMLFNEFEIPKIESVFNFGLDEILDQFFEELVDQMLKLSISWWLDIFYFVLILNILIFGAAFSISKDSFGGTAAWVVYEAVGIPPIGVWCQGINPSGEIKFTMYCPPTIASPQLYAIYFLFMWLYANFPEAHSWYNMDFKLADVEVGSFPSSISLVPGSTEDICFSVKNVGLLPADYEIVVEGLPEDYYSIDSSVYLNPGEEKNVCLHLNIPWDATAYDSFDYKIMIIYKPCPVQVAVVGEIESNLHIDEKVSPNFDIFDITIYDDEPFEYSIDILDSAGAEQVSAFLYYKGAFLGEDNSPSVTILDGAKRYKFRFPKPLQLGDYDIVIRAYCALGNYGSKSAIIHYLDDDETVCEITIDPSAQNVTDGDPTISFNVYVEDASGIFSLEIKFNNTLVGTTPGTYVIENPKKLGPYPIFVKCIDNDIDRGEIDRSINIEYALVNILDDDTTLPNITLNYFGSLNDGDPGIWEVDIQDLESGIYDINITVDGFLVGNNIGNYYVPNSLGSHIITVNTSNADLDRGLIDQEYQSLISSVYVIDDDIMAPIITDASITDCIHDIFIYLDASDDNSGDDQGISKIIVVIDGIFEETYYPDPDQTSFNIIIPNYWIMELGTHEIKIEVWDADDDRISDSMSSIFQGEFEVTFLEMLEFVIWEIEELLSKINNSPNNCWKNKNHKNAMSNKLYELISLISNGELDEGYNKLLHDIKPKLTGWKMDENGIPWDGGVFKNPWVTCGDLQEDFNTNCNEILKNIQILLNIP